MGRWVGGYVCLYEWMWVGVKVGVGVGVISCTPAYILCCLFGVTAETEKIGRVHTELSQKIVEEIDRSVKEFRTQQKEIRKRVGWSAWLLEGQSYLLKYSVQYVRTYVADRCGTGRQLLHYPLDSL